MKRKSIDNSKKPKKQTKSEPEVIIGNDPGDEMDLSRVPIKNVERAKPILKSDGIVAYKVADIKV
jgi:hypothetical protein